MNDPSYERFIDPTCLIGKLIYDSRDQEMHVITGISYILGPRQKTLAYGAYSHRIMDDDFLNGTVLWAHAYTGPWFTFHKEPRETTIKPS